MKKDRLIDFLQSAALLVLFTSMLLLCGVYISLTVNLKDSSLPAFPENEMSYIKGEGTASKEKDSHLVVPYFAAALSEDYMFACEYADAPVGDIWQCFVDVLANAPGGSSKKLSYSDPEKKYSYLDALYSEYENSFYVKLANPIEFSVLCALLSDTYKDIPENPDFEILDMFLVSDAGGEASITAVDTDGNVLKIFPSKKITFNKELFDTYNDTKSNNFDFIRLENSVMSGKNGYFPVFRHPLILDSVKNVPFAERFTVEIDSGDVKDFTAIFGMNLDNVRRYQSSDGAVIVLENTSRLTIAKNGDIEFLTDADPLPLSRFLGYNSEEYTFSDIVAASKSIIGKINKKLSGCAATLSLSQVVYGGGSVSLYYDYTVGGIPLMRDEGYSLCLEFSHNALLYAKGVLEPYIFSDGVKTDTSQKVAYAMIAGDISGEVDYFGAEYSFSDAGEIAIVRWTLKVREEADK